MLAEIEKTAWTFEIVAINLGTELFSESRGATTASKSKRSSIVLFVIKLLSQVGGEALWHSAFYHFVAER